MEKFQDSLTVLVGKRHFGKALSRFTPSVSAYELERYKAIKNSVSNK